ncbi:MAG: site-specific integrase [Parvularcula sp.]|jgi:integrase|nr:site-specific integrase [Parvularcula sp.]
MPKTKLTKTAIDRAGPADREYFLWDECLSGFGLRITPSGRKTFVLKYRTGHGRKAPTRRLTIGRYSSALPPDLARRKAREMLFAVLEGDDPAASRAEERKSLTVQEACDLYLRDGTFGKKASSIENNDTHIRRHIGPLIGRRRLQDLTRADVTRMMTDIAAGKTAIDERTGPRGRAIVRGGKLTANRVAALLSTVFTFAIDQGYVTQNPVLGVRRFPEHARNRFLSAEEFRRLAASLDHAERTGTNIGAVAIIRLLALTGARRSEITKLRWSEVDLERGLLLLADSKTGAKAVHLPPPAAKIIAEQHRIDGCDYVFPGSTLDRPFAGLSKVWGRIRTRANLPDVRLHDLRHSHASVAAAQGTPIAVIGKVLGHKRASTTERYAHLTDDPVRAAATATTAAIADHFATPAP